MRQLSCVVKKFLGRELITAWYQDQPVVVKIMKQNLVHVTAANFQKEIIMLSEVQHDLIVQFIGASDHAPFVILTEKMEGGTLKGYLERLRPTQLDPQKAIELALNVSRAMTFLHEKGIIHKELRPENVFLSLDHQKVKLDFGVAREESLQAKIDTQSAALSWVARELLVQDAHCYQTDVYSFAICLWELLTNQEPFKKAKVDYLAVLQAGYPNSKKIPKRYPDVVKRLYDQCLSAEEPSDRPEFSAITKTLTQLSKYFSSRLSEATSASSTS